MADQLNPTPQHDLDVAIELGRAQLNAEQIHALEGGGIVSLDKLAGDPVDVVADGRLVARGEVVVMDDKFCVRVVEIDAAGCGDNQSDA